MSCELGSIRKVVIYTSLALLTSFILVNSVTAALEKKNINKEEKRIESIEANLNEVRNDVMNRTMNMYQVTNDRINTHLTFISIIATIFGVIIAVGGILIGIESIKSHKRREEALKILEEAKNYVEDKKYLFDSVVAQKIDELEKEYQRFLNLLKEQLLGDINVETEKIKLAAAKKAEEIESFSVEKKSEEIFESFSKRIKFFESVGIPDDPKILFSKAKLLNEKQMYKEAIELLEKLLTIEPSNTDALWLLAYTSNGQKNYDKAAEMYLRYLELMPNDAAGHNNLGVAYDRQGKPYDALKQYEKAISLKENEALYHANRAKKLVTFKSYDEGIKSYKKAIELSPKDKNLYDALIKVLTDLNKYDDVIEYYDIAIKSDEDASKQFNMRKAVFLKGIGRLDEAKSILLTLVEQGYMSDKCYMEIAEIEFRLGHVPDSEATIDKAISLNPKNDELYLKKADLFAGTQVDKAYEIILKGFEHIGKEGFLQMGARIMVATGHLDKAKELYEKTNKVLEKKLSENPNDEGCIMNYYEGLLICDKYDEADRFIADNKNKVKDDKYQPILSYLKICEKALKGDIKSLKDEKDLLNPFNDPESIEKVTWGFEDMGFSLKTKLERKLYESIMALSDLILRKITVDEFKKKLSEG